MIRNLIAAAFMAVMLDAAPATSDVELKPHTLYDKKGWLVEFLEVTDDPATEANEATKICNIWVHFVEGENHFNISISNDPVHPIGIAVRSAKYAENAAKGMIGDATIEVDNVKFTGAAKKLKKAVYIGHLEPLGFLKALKTGRHLVATLPVVTPNTASFGLEDAAIPLELFEKCVNDNVGKDPDSLL